MIPGPIEFDSKVLQAMGSQTLSHVDPDFIQQFGQALERMREVWLAPDGQPFIVAGSGTLAMELAVANIVEPGDNALVVKAGYFSDRMAAILERHGCRVDQVEAPLGGRPEASDIEMALSKKSYKLMSITHVDTSTGVVADVYSWTEIASQAGVLTVVDGVCAMAGEKLRQSDWGVDVAFTASQKAIGVPPGLALLVASPRAMKAFRDRKHPVGSYYADWSNWLPIMESYEARKASYFGTPAVNQVIALNISLGQILEEGMDQRFQRHEVIGRAVRSAVTALGMKTVPLSEELAANTMTAPYYPDGIDSSLLGHVREAGAVLAGGLHPEIKTKYFRIGHMGITGVGEVLATIGAVEAGLCRAGYQFEPGKGVAAAQAVLLDLLF
jgi:alanine-glyoxylate transaminase/serine-glyoxylate transaminase/serine-pyruvate transaminase